MKINIIFLCIGLLFIGCSMPVNNDSNSFQPTVRTQPAITTPQDSTQSRVVPVDATNKTDTYTETENSTEESGSETVPENDTEDNTLQIDWDSVIAEINRRLYVLGCNNYNDRYFRDRKEYDCPEVECDVYYMQMQGLEYTRTMIDRFTENGGNHWYFHYELAHTMENLNIVCDFLGIELSDLGIVL